MLQRLLFALSLYFCATLSTAAGLPEPVLSALRAAGIPAQDYALWIAPAAGGAPRLAWHADRPMNPASLMKLVTGYAALDKLGPAHTWRTEAYLGGPLADGVLQGDLIVRGSGDPLLTWDRLGQFLRELRGRGLREIRGDLVLDRSRYALPAYDPAAFDGQPLRAYNAGPDALLTNFGTLSLRLRPAGDGTVAVQLLTPYTPFIVDNRVYAADGECSDWRAGLQLALDPVGEGYTLRLAGSLPVSCGERVLHLAAQDPPRLFAGIFRTLWAELGGVWQGRLREGVVPAPGADAPAGEAWAGWTSPPLVEVLRETEKFSNNVMARQLLLALAPAVGPDGVALAASPAAGAAALQQWLAARALALPGLEVANGDGLSRQARLTAAGLGALLRHAWAGPHGPDYVSALPRAGIDGTARRRFQEHPAAGRAYLKTGSLDEVSALAGYVQDGRGRWWVLVSLLNHPRADFSAAVQGAALSWLLAQAQAQ